MYQTYWGLQQKPFENNLDTGFYYPCESHQAALLKLRYALDSGRSAALLCGAAGTGKTLLAGMLKKYCSEKISSVTHLVFPKLPPAELLAYIAFALDGNRTKVNSNDLALYSLQRIEHYLQKNRLAGRQSLLILDEAHLIDDPESWEMLRLLLNFSKDEFSPLSLILFGQTALLPLMEQMPPWEERLAVKCLLRSLNEEEVDAYIEHRLQTAGATRSLFTKESIRVLHELTGGTPRKINRLADLALLIGYAEERQVVDASLVEAVSEELLCIQPE